MEALPTYLDKIFHPVVAVLLYVTFVLLFGKICHVLIVSFGFRAYQMGIKSSIIVIFLIVHHNTTLNYIIPQATYSKYGLAVGANFVWLMRILMIICYPIAYPVEKEAMTPIESTFSLAVNSKLDCHMAAVVRVKGKGSNLQPHDGKRAVGENKVNYVDSELSAPVLPKADEKSHTVMIDVDEASSRITLDDHSFKKYGAMTNSLIHLSEDTEVGKIIGIITLEDIFEELLQGCGAKKGQTPRKPLEDDLHLS